MPHLILQHDLELGAEADLDQLCDDLNDCMVATGIFPLSGVRVRAVICEDYSIADKHPDNRFLAAQLYMGAGRSDDQKRAAGDAINAVLVDFFSEQLSAGHFLLSLDIFENNPALSWKTNSIRKRLSGE